MILLCIRDARVWVCGAAQQVNLGSTTWQNQPPLPRVPVGLGHPKEREGKAAWVSPGWGRTGWSAGTEALTAASALGQ